jgi:AcrR family transcriptional regulator
MITKPNEPDRQSRDTDPATYRDRLSFGILAIAMRVIENEGVSALQARRVAVEAGCSVGTIYNIFGDLDGLILRANATTLAQMGGELRTVYDATCAEPVPARLTALALAYMEFALSNRMRWRAIFDHRLPPGKAVPEDYDDSRSELLSLLSQAVASENTDTALAMRAARSMFAAVHGVITLALDNKLSPFDARVVEADVRFIIGAAANGLAAAQSNL